MRGRHLAHEAFRVASGGGLFEGTAFSVGRAVVGDFWLWIRIAEGIGIGGWFDIAVG